MRLSKTQRELLEQLQAGNRLHYMPYRGWFNKTAYFFVDGTNSRCTAAANALVNLGLVTRKKKGFADATFEISELGKAWKP